MVHRHPTTPAQRVHAASRMLAQQGVYGMVTQLSRELHVSRQTLYTWRDHARQALDRAFLAVARPTTPPPLLPRQVLSLLIEGHNSYADIQRCLRQLTGQSVSLGTISAIVQDAQQRALAWMATHAPTGLRSIALDEIYGTDRHGAYLHIVDTQSWAVWAAHGPLPVDTESWTLVLWLAQERGLRWHATSSDGGCAIHAACQVVDPTGQHGRDVWHILHTCAQVQGRLDRLATKLDQQTATVARQAARVAAGQAPQGRRPKVDLDGHTREVAQASTSAADVAYLTQELRRLLEVVVLDRRGLVSPQERAADLEALLALLTEVAGAALPAGAHEIARLQRQVGAALPGLLAFVPPIAQVEQELGLVVGAAGLALLAWAWQRETILGPAREQVLAGVPAGWRAAGRVLMETWDRAVRSSSAVENWHSLLRPHLAVHRGLSGGMLALLAVWHNHRVFTRGVHAGQSPLQLSGMGDAPTDWLVALGYPAEDPDMSTLGPPPPVASMALAA